MLKPKFALCSALCVLMLNALPSALAESSTGIRLGETDFGGKRSTQLGTDRSFDRPNKQLGTFSRHNTDRHDNNYRDHYSGSDGYKKHYKHQPSYGISGHPSYGFTPQSQRHKNHHDYNHRPYRDYYHDRRGLSAYYSYKDHIGISFYSAPVSSYSYAYSASPISLSDSRYQPYSYAEKPTDNSIDPWQALGDYQLDTARYAFESQMQQQPNAALPKVGYALSKALSGEIQAGAYLMENALLSNVSDLRYFNTNADPDLQLVIAELLLSYPEDPFMSASLHYLNRDYIAADRALQRAQQRCDQCPAIDNLALLIEQHP